MGFLSKGHGHKCAQSFRVSHTLLVTWRNNLPVMVGGTVSLQENDKDLGKRRPVPRMHSLCPHWTWLHVCVRCLVCLQAGFSPHSLSFTLTNLFSHDAYLTTFRSLLLPQQCEGSCLCFAPTTWGRKELDTTKRLSTVSLSITPGVLHFSMIQTVESKNSYSACGE